MPEELNTHHTFHISVSTPEPERTEVVLKKVQDQLRYGNLQSGPDLINVKVKKESFSRVMISDEAGINWSIRS